MIYIYKTSHLLQHNSKMTPNTQFKVDQLRQLEGSKHNLSENGSTTQKAIFTRIKTIPENAQVAQTGNLEPVGQTNETHN